jgi:hypothetical protein
VVGKAAQEDLIPGDRFIPWLYEWVDRFPRLASQHWRSQVATLVLAISLFFCFPWYPGMSKKPWDAVLESARHPLQDVGYGQGSHAARLIFRPVVPFIGGLLHLNIAGYIVLQAAAGVAIFIIFITVAERFIDDRAVCLLLLAAFGATYAGVMSFVELRGIFDGIALLFVLLALVWRRPALIVLLAFIAPWTDERALVAFGFVIVFWQVQWKTARPESSGGGRSSNLRISPQAVAVAVGMLLYGASRLIVTLAWDLPTGVDSGDGAGRAIDQINNLPVGVWTGLEGLWILPILSLAVLIKRRELLTAAIFFLTMATLVIFAMSVVDITRSMAYLAPATLASLPVLTENFPAAYLRRLVGLAFVASVIWPVYYAGGKSTLYWIYPLPLQVVNSLAG